MELNSLDKLRTRIRQIEGLANSFSGEMDTPLKGDLHNDSALPVWSLGSAEIDQLFSGGLSPHDLHEITPAHYRDSWAALSFMLALLSRRARSDQRPILWCSSSIKHSEFGNLYGHGLRRFGLDPRRFILIETRNEVETAFVLEEALKSDRLCAVFGLLDGLDLIRSRRLSLMASKGRTPALLMTRPGETGIKTATTRWQIANTPPDQSLFATSPFSQSTFSQLTWQVALLRNRQGPADKQWHLEFPFHDRPFHKNSGKAFCFNHPSPFRNRKLPAFKAGATAA